MTLRKTYNDFDEITRLTHGSSMRIGKTINMPRQVEFKELVSIHSPYIIIIGISDYSQLDETGKTDLPAVENDVDQLRRLFRKYNYKYIVSIHNYIKNKENKEEFINDENLEDFLIKQKNTILKLINDKTMESPDSIFIFYAGHGKSKGIVLCSGETFLYKAFERIFGNQSIPQLIQKPKCLYFDCCRGKVGIVIIGNSIQNNKITLNNNSRGLDDNKNSYFENLTQTNKFNDIMWTFSTINGIKSYDDKKNGHLTKALYICYKDIDYMKSNTLYDASLKIKTLVQQFSKSHQTCEIVNRLEYDVKLMQYESNKKQNKIENYKVENSESSDLDSEEKNEHSDSDIEENYESSSSDLDGISQIKSLLKSFNLNDKNNKDGLPYLNTLLEDGFDNVDDLKHLYQEYMVKELKWRLGDTVKFLRILKNNNNNNSNEQSNTKLISKKSNSLLDDYIDEIINEPLSNKKDNLKDKNESKTESEKYWKCNICTFKNALNKTKCEMCGTNQGSKIYNESWKCNKCTYENIGGSKCQICNELKANPTTNTTQSYLKHDQLGLSKNSVALKLLSRIGENFPIPEKVVLSDTIIKINNRNKEQKRVVLITNKALYDLKPKEYGKCQRRIDIDKIVNISNSKEDDTFAIHIPEEYDYRYKSKNKLQIIEVLQDQFHKLSKGTENLVVSHTGKKELLRKTITNYEARVLTREQRYQRYLELMGKQNFEDEVLDAKQARNTQSLIKTKEKIQPDDFEFLKVIGQGSFGKVIQVRKKGTNDIYAMKILKKKYLIEKHQVNGTLAERKILQSLQHPFLMQLKYAFQTGSKLYFVLDFFRGGELFFHLKKMRRFSEKQARFFVAEIGMALGHLHSLDIIHRDLKPENILLDDNGHICLTDFGTVKELGEDGITTSFCGTPEYLAPEVVMNVGHGKPVDWWSFGILLYELICGITPFYDQNFHNMYRKIQQAPLMIPNHLSKYSKDLIAKLLIRDPKKRLGSGSNDFKDIQSHPFFKTTNWDLIYKKEIDPPYKPRLKGGKDDISCFDTHFTKQIAQDSHVQDGENDGFNGFTFAPTLKE